MNVGKRHRRAPQLGRLFALMSVIALACACFPALAQAECTSSSCVQYTENIPKAEGENGPTSHGQKTPAKASKTGDGSGGSNSQPQGSDETEGSEEGESSDKEGAVAGGGGGNGQGKPDASAQGGAKNALHPGDQGDSLAQTSKSDDGGSSSPLVPILIAIAVLAAISVAVVMARQRRQRRGPTGTASPEAN